MADIFVCAADGHVCPGWSCCGEADGCGESDGCGQVGSQEAAQCYCEDETFHNMMAVVSSGASRGRKYSQFLRISSDSFHIWLYHLYFCAYICISDIALMEEINLREELAKIRDAVKGIERNADPESREAYWELCCGDVLLAEENVRERRCEWENSSLAGELLDAAGYLADYDDMHEKLYAALRRMCDALFDHPRLKLQLLEFRLRLLNCKASLGDMEDVADEIDLYRRNIAAADRLDFDSIESRSYIKSDPIEWTGKYEKVIDEANKMIYARLEDCPAGMGFCHAYWLEKAHVLSEDYGIFWRSPAELNPGVMFD